MMRGPHAILARAAELGVTVRLRGPDRIGIGGPKERRPEILEAVTANKPALLVLLRAGREAEVKAFFAQTFTRLGALYGDDLIGNLWPSIVAQHPTLAHAIDTAEAAVDGAAVAYQTGSAPDSGQFLVTLAEWESRWREGIAAVTASGNACDDCGRTDTTILVTTDTGRFCRACLRPAPLNTKPKTKGVDA